MIQKGTFQLLRLPFSINLLPLYLFALHTAKGQVITWKAILVFVLIHFVFYPASNAYNSYMDQDTSAIAGVEKPPAATSELYRVSIILDTIGLLLSMLIGLWFLLINVALVLLSRAYSWHGVRIKKYAWVGFLMVAIAQGGISYLNMRMGIQATWESIDLDIFRNIVIATLFVGAIYPITQIYQHREDAANGDTTVSMKVGIRGTFVLSGGIFLLAGFLLYHSLDIFEYIVFIIFMLPTFVYFAYWTLITWKDERNANFKHCMKMILISAIGMNLGFLTILFIK